MSKRVPCGLCDGEGYTYAVYGQLDTYEECPRCEGTGDAYGRGATLPEPSVPLSTEDQP